MVTPPIRFYLQQNSPEWHAWRDSGGPGNPRPYAIGASDSPILAGLSPYKTVDDLWRQKVGLAKREKSTWIMERGHYLEPEARELYETSRRTKIPPVCLAHPHLQWVLASLDGLNEDGDIAVEIKLHGSADHEMVRSGICPAKHYAQLQHQLEVSGADVIHLVSYYKPVDSEEYGDLVILPVFPNRGFISLLFDRIEVFMQCCESGTPPSDHPIFKTALKPSEGPRSTWTAPTMPAPQPEPAPQRVKPAQVEVMPKGFITRVDPGDAVVSVQTLSEGKSTIILAPQWVDERDEWIAEAQAIQIVDQESADRAGFLANSHTKLRKGINDAVKKACAPHKAVIDEIKAVADQLLGVSTPVEDDLKKRIAAWLEASEKQRKAEEQQRLAAMASGDVSAAMIPAEPERKGTSKVSGMAVTKNIRIEVTDESVVDHRFFSIDMKKLQEFATETVNKDTWGSERRVLIPGVVAWVETGTRGTGK